MSAVCRNRRSTRGEVGAALVCGQKLLFPYKAPLSRTILLEWLRKMPNRELGIAVSSAAVSSDRSKNSPPLPPLVLPLPLRASPFPQPCDCVAKLWLLFLLPCPCPLYIVCDRRRSSGEEAGAPESTFLRGCHSIWRMCRERRASVGAKRKREIDKKERKSERISVISVDNVMYVATKRNDTTFAK